MRAAAVNGMVPIQGNETRTIMTITNATRTACLAVGLLIAVTPVIAAERAEPVVALPTPTAPASASPQGDSWESVKKLPDWGGVWASMNLPSAKTMPFNAKGKAQAATLAKLREINGDIPSRAKHCILNGFPGGMSGPEEYTEEFLYTPGQVTMTQVQGFVRRIYTDGRKHHTGPLTLQGDSIGHWEGGTLVVDTTNMDAGNEIFYGFPGGKNMHAVEHIGLARPDLLQITTTIEAPEIIVGKHDYVIHYKRHRDWTPLEMNCAQNNRSIDANGHQTLIMK